MPDHLRVSVGLQEENKYFLDSLKDLLDGRGGRL